MAKVATAGAGFAEIARRLTAVTSFSVSSVPTLVLNSSANCIVVVSIVRAVPSLVVMSSVVTMPFVMTLVVARPVPTSNSHHSRILILLTHGNLLTLILNRNSSVGKGRDDQEESDRGS
jgi:hypothetical protein